MSTMALRIQSSLKAPKMSPIDTVEWVRAVALAMPRPPRSFLSASALAAASLAMAS
jgi:hypothetical protein